MGPMKQVVELVSSKIDEEKKRRAAAQTEVEEILHNGIAEALTELLSEIRKIMGDSHAERL